VSAAVGHGADLEREARRAEMSGDPLGPVLRALASTATAMDRAMAEVSRQIEQNRQPMPKDVVRQAVAEGVRFATLDVVRAFNLRTILAAAGAVIVLMVAAFGAGYLVHGDQLMVAGLSAGDQTCRPQNGGVLCYIPVWKTLPPAANNK
jgi:hypothetical protein